MQDKQLEDAKHTLTTRFEEFIKLHKALIDKAKGYHRWGTLTRLTIIVLGAILTGQATAREQMNDSRGLILFFASLAALMTIAAGLESFFRWEHKSGALQVLAAICAASLYEMHDRWHRVTSEYLVSTDAAHLAKVLKLADADLELINKKIVEIHNRAAEFGLPDLVMEHTSLKPRDMFAVKDWNPSKSRVAENDDAQAPRSVPAT